VVAQRQRATISFIDPNAAIRLKIDRYAWVLYMPQENTLT
jgi:hypothetical protein